MSSGTSNDARNDAIGVFDRLYTNSPDPWGTHVRWYERRKRALLLAALPRDRYDNVYEAGCGTGHISAALAARCGSLLASDASETALAIARPLVSGLGNVTLERHELPRDWPTGTFALIVLSELLYFLDAAQRRAVASAARRSAGPLGTIVACDWRGPIEGRGHRGEDVHRAFAEEIGLPAVFEYADDDFLLTGWSADTRTPAEHDGLR